MVVCSKALLLEVGGGAGEVGYVLEAGPGAGEGVHILETGGGATDGVSIRDSSGSLAVSHDVTVVLLVQTGEGVGADPVGTERVDM